MLAWSKPIWQCWLYLWTREGVTSGWNIECSVWSCTANSEQSQLRYLLETMSSTSALLICCIDYCSLSLVESRMEYFADILNGEGSAWLTNCTVLPSLPSVLTDAHLFHENFYDYIDTFGQKSKNDKMCTSNIAARVDLRCDVWQLWIQFEILPNKAAKLNS